MEAKTPTGWWAQWTLDYTGEAARREAAVRSGWPRDYWVAQFLHVVRDGAK